MISQPAGDRYTIFLHGEYLDRDAEFYRSLIAESVSVAVDGGFELFERLGLPPNIALGDFDTRPDVPRLADTGIEIITFDSRKDKTDGQLAVELAVARGAVSVTLCGYHGGAETDHVLGNLLLLAHGQSRAAAGRSVDFCARRPGEQVWFVADGELQVSGRADDTVTVAPLDTEIHLSASGLSYPAENLTVKRGSTRSFRNCLIGERATVRVSGAALVFWRAAPSKR